MGALGDLRTLARLVVLASALGNLDMHAKNLGLLHHPDGSIRLAPGYDFVPQTHIPGIDQQLALAVDRRYAIREVTGAHLVREFQSWRLTSAQDLVHETLVAALAVAESESPHPAAWPGLQQDVIGHANRLLQSL